MKKTTLAVIIVIIAILGFWYIKNKPATQSDTSLKTYSNTNLGISFSYPKVLNASTTSQSVTLHHDVPFVHHDYCDFKGEGNTTINTLSDLNLGFHLVNLGLVATMKTESPYLPESNFVNGEVVPSPGFIDVYEAGDLKGFRIFEGAEGCGQTVYYFPISSNKTLVAKEALVTVFTGSIDQAEESRALAVPGVINKVSAEAIIKSIFGSVVVR